MTRLIIADDEKVIRESLQALIDWKSLGIDVVAVCSNGIDAYEAILDLSPDIILTDIKMPGIDGIGLIEKTCAMKIPCEFVLLSGYADFEFAQRAMQFGVRHYVTKPCDNELLIREIRQAIEELHRKQYHLSLEQKEVNRVAYENLLLKMAIREAVSGVNPERIRRHYHAFLNFNKDSYVLCSMVNVGSGQSEEICGRLKSMPGQEHMIWGGTYDEVQNQLFLVFRSESFLEEYTEDILKNTICGDSRWETMDLQQIIVRLADVVCDHWLLFESEHARSVPANLGSISELLDLEKNSPDSFSDSLPLDRWVQTLTDRELVLYVYVRIVLLAATAKNGFHMVNPYVGLSELLQTGMTAQEMVTNILQICTSGSAEKPRTKYKPFIERLLAYTEEHLDNPNLSLKWIAENVLYMNMDYLGKQFFSQTGMKFSHYLNELRVNKAKELLRDSGEEKLIMIAERVGFGSNPKYFGQIFKKYTGMTPSMYIESRSKA